jgi:hypothetical protein
MLRRVVFLSLMGGGLLAFAQNEPIPQNPPVPQPGPAAPQSSQPQSADQAVQRPAAAQQPPSGGLKQREEPSSSNGTLIVAPGTHVLLNMINSVSTKQAQVGDRIYLETAFPVLSGNHIVVPQGSWVTGTVTYVKRPARVKGRGELQVRFDSLTLPNGVTRNFRSDLGALDGRSNEDINRERSTIKGPGDKTGDAETVMTTTAAGAGIGTLAGAASGHALGGGLIGLGAGAAAGMAAVMLSRGPDATLLRGSSVEMVLDRSLSFQPDELDFKNVPPRAPLSEGSQTPAAQRRTLGSRFPGF